MLKNFIKTSDLQKFYPTLDQDLWRNTSDYSVQITQGFERVNSDLWTKDIDPRKVMLPISLNNTSGTIVHSMFKRLYLTPASGDGIVTLMGSQDNATFVTVATVDTSDYTDVIVEDAYKYYKYSSTVTMSKVEFYETVFDRSIIFASLILIFRDFMKEAGDVWDLKRQMAEADYADAINSVKYYYDNNDNQSVEDEELDTSSDITFTR